MLPSLIPVVVNLGKMVNFIINIGGAFLNGFISFINFGVRAQEATFGFLKDFGGEKFADAFAKFGGLLQGVLDGMLILGALTLSDALSGDSGFGLGDLFGKKLLFIWNSPFYEVFTYKRIFLKCTKMHFHLNPAIQFCSNFAQMLSLIHI